MKELPIALEIPYQDPAALFEPLSQSTWAFLLDSADANYPFDDTNRYSYFAFDPFETITIKDQKRIDNEEPIHDPFDTLKKNLSNFQMELRNDLPPFQGGAMGYFSYDLCHYLENIHRPRQTEKSIYPDMAIGLFDVIVAFDHHLKKAWIISTGFPEKTLPKQLHRAKERLSNCLEKLSAKNQMTTQQNKPHKKIQLASTFTQQSYAALVKKAQQYILEGDIFEVNLSQRFETELNLTDKDKYKLYLHMRKTNPSPFSAFLNLGDHQILSTSPERFLSLTNNKVSTRPIKGTAPRGKTPEDDKINVNHLIQSEKDRSENIMIADLLRNDLSKVCIPDSIKIKKLCGLESYPTVHHLVTVIEGKLQPNINALDLLKACFPGGSITGAPKVRAMQIIYELEPTQRGPYCGSIGYIGFNGSMDTSIAIRTLLLQNNKMSYQAGGAVILDSSPEGEYEETLTKSISIQKTLSDWIEQ